MLLISLMIILFLILILMVLGYNHLILRIIKLYKKENINKKIKVISVLTSIIITVLTVLSFNKTYGLFSMHFLVFAYIFELIYLLVKKLSKKDFIKFDSIRKLCIIPLVLTCIYFAYGYYNMQDIKKVEYKIKTEKEISQNYKIALITDVHYGLVLNKNKLEKIVKEISDQKPDIVILGGDIVDESTKKDEMKEVFQILSKINSKFGIYYVFGNHDKQNYSMNRKFSVDELKNEITKNNIKILIDDVEVVNDDLIIYGREDLSNKRKDLAEYIDLEENQEKFAITIDHQPVEYKINDINKVDLILSGHTHAGQIFPVRYIIDILKTADLSYGYKKENNLNAIVSSGLSGWGYPIRTYKHSEYVIIDVEK